MVQAAIDGYAKADLPLETIYLDIPYMDNYQDFTVDTTAFPNIQDLAKSLHDANKRLVLIIDAAISVDKLDNPYYLQGDKDNIFIKSGQWTSKTYNNNLINKVWPNKAVFIDWFEDKCMNTWSKGLNDLHS